MIKVERLSEIEKLLLKKRQVSVYELSQLLNSSKVTIRSDLEELEHKGILRRAHGGAVLIENSEVTDNKPITSDDKEIFTFSAKKLAIARMATLQLNENDWIYLDSGSTCCAIADVISKAEISINVLTNNLVAAYLLSRNQRINVMVAGGKADNSDFPYLHGDTLLRMMTNITLSKSFIGVDGIDLKKGFSIMNPEEKDSFPCLREHSKEIIIVADSSKFGITSFLIVGELLDADKIITNSDISEDFTNYFAENNIHLICAK